MLCGQHFQGIQISSLQLPISMRHWVRLQLYLDSSCVLIQQESLRPPVHSNACQTYETCSLTIRYPTIYLQCSVTSTMLVCTPHNPVFLIHCSASCFKFVLTCMFHGPMVLWFAYWIPVILVSPIIWFWSPRKIRSLIIHISRYRYKIPRVELV